MVAVEQGHTQLPKTGAIVGVHFTVGNGDSGASLVPGHRSGRQPSWDSDVSLPSSRVWGLTLQEGISEEGKNQDAGFCFSAVDTGMLECLVCCRSAVGGCEVRGAQVLSSPWGTRGSVRVGGVFWAPTGFSASGEVPSQPVDSEDSLPFLLAWRP